MKTKKVHSWSIIFLVFLAISGISGGIGLLTDPTGANLELPLSVLKNSPFQDFFYPGIMLFIFMGLMPILVIILAILRTPSFPRWMIFQGIVLALWLIVEMLFGIFDWYLTLLYLAIAVILFMIGLRLTRRSSASLQQ